MIAFVMLLPCGTALSKESRRIEESRDKTAEAASPEEADRFFEGRGTPLYDLTDPMRGIRSLGDVKAPAVTSDFSTIRVLISTGGVSYVDFSLCASYYLPGTNVLLEGTEDSPVSIRVSGSGSTVTLKNKTTGDVLASGSSVELLRLYADYTMGYAELSHSSNSYTQNAKYLGSFKFMSDSGKVKIINTVPMAYYLFGIIGYELSTSSKPEALKAQALAAKTYGIFFMDSSADYDVQDGWTSSLYQGYRGYREDRLSTMQYCTAVIGKALSYNNTFIPTFYGHTDGGETSLPSHVFNANDTRYDGGYGVKKDDIEFNNYSSSKQLINVDFGGTGDSSRFRDFILGKINDEFSVNSTEVVSIDGLYAFDPLPGTTRNMRQLHVEATVKVRIYVADPTATPTAAPTATPDPTDTPDSADGGDSKGYTTVTRSYTFECPIKQLRTYALTDIDGSGDNYSSSKYVFTASYKLYWGKTKTNGYTLVFARNGNGVGLSQIGANIRANPSTYAQTYQEILAFYYPNFSIINITETAPANMPGPTVSDPEIVAYGICTDNNTNFRMGPDTAYPSMGKVQANEHLDIVDASTNGWYKAIWNGMVGYIIMDYSKIIMFPAPQNGVFTLTDGQTSLSCNLRSEPFERDGNVIVRLAKYTSVTCWAKVGKWYYVTTENGYAGYLHQDVLTLGEPYEYIGMSSLIVKEYPTIHFASPIKPTPSPAPGTAKQKERG